MKDSIAISILIFVALLLIVGLYLLISGWRGRRVGSEPRCRKCGYILLHLTSARCPECGTTISAPNTVIGEHQRRWGRATTGIILMILGCVPMMAPEVRNNNWYRYLPASFVLRGLDFPATFQKSMWELERRDVLEKTLPESAKQKLIDKLLQKQVELSKSPTGHNSLVYLSKAFMDGHLTESQMELFLDQAILATIAVRPIVTEGDHVSFSVRYTGSIPPGFSPWFWCQHKDTLCKHDDQIELLHRGDSSSFRLGSLGNSHELSVPAGAVGKHVIEIESTWTIWYGAFRDEAGSRKLDTRTRTIKASYEVVPR
ncbi:MAG: hypothetical protein FWD61_18135 [Phycisphaerales bacterium]|nr:hypothetical protein [Phycisphaerales bacterium]